MAVDARRARRPKLRSATLLAPRSDHVLVIEKTFMEMSFSQLEASGQAIGNVVL
jgi:RNase P protein component